jgi:hypothetical protein
MFKFYEKKMFYGLKLDYFIKYKTTHFKVVKIAGGKMHDGYVRVKPG